jgi:hypothetical protein
VAQLEVLCKQLYETGNANLRAEAEKALVQFSAQPDCLNKCQLLLERANVSSYYIISILNVEKLIAIHGGRHYIFEQLVCRASRRLKLVAPKRFFLVQCIKYQLN